MKQIFGSFAVLFFSLCSGASAQDAATCNALLSAGLISQTSETVNQTIASQQFDDFCSVDRDYSSRFAGQSQAFQASFSYAGFGVGGGASSASTSGNTDETFRKVCKQGKQSFLSNFSRSFAARDGAAVAKAYNDCLRILTAAGTPILWGTVTRVPQDDETFLVQLQYRGGANSPQVDLFVANILATPRDTECYVDKNQTQNALDVKPTVRGTLTLSCRKPAGADVAGMISVENKMDGFRPAPLVFQLSSNQIAPDAETKLLDKIATLQDELIALRSDSNARIQSAVASAQKELQDATGSLHQQQAKLQSDLAAKVNGLRFTMVRKPYTCDAKSNNKAIACPNGWLNTGAVLYDTWPGGSCGEGSVYNVCVKKR